MSSRPCEIRDEALVSVVPVSPSQAPLIIHRQQETSCSRWKVAESSFLVTSEKSDLPRAVFGQNIYTSIKKRRKKVVSPTTDYLREFQKQTLQIGLFVLLYHKGECMKTKQFFFGKKISLL